MQKIRVVLAVGFCLLLVGAIGVWTWPEIRTLPVRSHEDARERNYRPGGSKCKPSAIAAIGVEKNRSEQAERCEKEAESYRLDTDDLVQQTRAADAAIAQIGIANQQLRKEWLQTLGGILTLISAFFAALYAAASVQHSRKGNELAGAAQRPWVVFEVEITGVKVTAKGITLNIEARAKNIGQSVADKLTFATFTCLGGDGINDLADKTRKAADGANPDARMNSIPTPLAPGQVRRNWVEEDRSKLEIDRRGITERAPILIFMAARYFSPGDPKQKATEAAFVITEAKKSDVFARDGISVPFKKTLSIGDVALFPKGQVVIT